MVKEISKHLLLDFRQMKEFCADPFVLKEGQGLRLMDVDGKTYIDGISGIFVVNVGHGNQTVIGAIKNQLDRLAFAPPLNAANDMALRLTNLLLQIAPPGFSTVKLLSGGSEATEAAIKMARQFQLQTGNPKKYKIVARYQGYHGATLGALSATGMYERKVPFEPLVSGFVHVVPPYCYRCPFDQTYPSCGLTCAKIMDRTVQWEGEDSVAAVIVEPVMVSGGFLVPPKEYLPMLREICDRRGVLLVFDEIITGFGRLGNMFAAEFYGVVPDILCLGKGMSSGYAPLSAIMCQDRVAKAFWGEPEEHVEFNHGHTYGGNPVACAAGLASIGETIEKDLCANAAEMGKYLRDKAQALYHYEMVGDVRGEGLLLGVELVKDRDSKMPFDSKVRPGVKVGKVAREKGLLVRGGANFVGLAPPLIASKQDIDEIYGTLEESLAEVNRELLGEG